jgi:hypothetical protein
MAGAAIRMVEPTTIHRQKNPRGKWEKISRNAS